MFIFQSMFFFTIVFFIIKNVSGEELKIVKSAPETIRSESIFYSNDIHGYHLPLAAHWNTGFWGEHGFNPDYQLRMIEQGHYLIPSFYLPDPTRSNMNFHYYEAAIRKAATLNLPISFISTQWERYLSDSPNFFSLPSERNPNVIDISGKVVNKVSPFGPVAVWREMGRKWATTPVLKKLQQWYPAPPLVLFVSNNEHRRLDWHEVESSRRYLAEHGKGRDGDFKRRVVGNGWIERYRALQAGLRAGLDSEVWREKALFVGFNAFGTGAFGRWPGWKKYSLYTPQRIEPWPLAWDGASLPYYVNNWNASTDYAVMSPQIEAMNWVFMRGEAQRLNPGFWLELSTWDGHAPTKGNDKRKFYERMGQVFDPDRYEGFVQFGMWLLRPRVVREFRDERSSVAKDGPYFGAVISAVDRVHNNSTLSRFWKKGRLVANHRPGHPYQENIPIEYKDAERWFLVDAELNPKRPWSLDTKIPIYSLALVVGEKPNREWLIYAHSPLEARAMVKISVIDSFSTTIDVPTSGIFYIYSEKNDSVYKVT
ncbi:MAG: hypothetical protein JXB25_03715 [Deltaproteobacteria bacterium]|nr:hypothetical protein [Deltaproteobacteria bacterium]